MARSAGGLLGASHGCLVFSFFCGGGREEKRDTEEPGRALYIYIYIYMYRARKGRWLTL